MKRKNNYKENNLKVIKSDDKSNEYTNEEITSAITLASIMAKEDHCSEQTSNEIVVKNAMTQVKCEDSLFCSTQIISESKRSCCESGTQTISETLPSKQESTASHNLIQISATHTMPTNPYPFGGVYGVYPMDTSFGYPMNSMQPNICSTTPSTAMFPNYGPMPQMSYNCGPTSMIPTNYRQCPYCLAPNVSLPVHSSTFKPLEKPIKQSEPSSAESVCMPSLWTENQNSGSTPLLDNDLSKINCH